MGGTCPMQEGQCRFRHDEAMKAKGKEGLKQIPCPSFKKEGGCRYGEACWMLHAPVEEGKPAPSANAASARLLEQQMEAVASLEAITGAYNHLVTTKERTSCHDHDLSQRA